jgi:hypothetical protein
MTSILQQFDHGRYGMTLNDCIMGIRWSLSKLGRVSGKVQHAIMYRLN